MRATDNGVSSVVSNGMRRRYGPGTGAGAVIA